jgi:hypothetical protein
MLKTLKGKIFKKSTAENYLERELLIAKEAYLLAEQRGFEPGHELDDWFMAVSMVDAKELMKPAKK